MTFSCRIVSTSLNDFVAPINRVFNVSTTVTLWSLPCFVAPRSRAAWFCSSAMAVFSAWMSDLITALSSAMSRAGSSNMDERLAKAVSFSSFWDVPWIPWPMREDIFANSEVVPAAFEPPLEGVEPDPSKGCVPDASPTAPVEPEDPGGPPPCLCARVFAARSAAAANSRVRSFTDADIAADISPSSLVDEGSRDADEFPVERCGRDGLGYAEAPDAAPGRVGAGTATVEGHS